MEDTIAKEAREKLTNRAKDNLLNEQFGLEDNILQLIQNLIVAEWDSDTLKNKIIVLMKERDVIQSELYKMESNDSRDNKDG